MIRSILWLVAPTREGFSLQPPPAKGESCLQTASTEIWYILEIARGSLTAALQAAAPAYLEVPIILKIAVVAHAYLGGVELFRRDVSFDMRDCLGLSTYELKQEFVCVFDTQWIKEAAGLPVGMATIRFD